MNNNNFQGGNGMPPNMMRPQQTNQQAQVQSIILRKLQENPMTQGWQATVTLNERATFVWQLTTSLSSIGRPINDALGIALGFEQQTINACANKAVYADAVRSKLNQIQMQRQKLAEQAMLNPNPQAPQMNNGMSQQGMGGQQAMNGNMQQMQFQNPNGFPQGVNPQMQAQQMQPSPLAMQNMQPQTLSNNAPANSQLFQQQQLQMAARQRQQQLMQQHAQQQAQQQQAQQAQQVQQAHHAQQAQQHANQQAQLQAQQHAQQQAQQQAHQQAQEQAQRQAQQQQEAQQQQKAKQAQQQQQAQAQAQAKARAAQNQAPAQTQAQAQAQARAQAQSQAQAQAQNQGQTLPPNFAMSQNQAMQAGQRPQSRVPPELEQKINMLVQNMMQKAEASGRMKVIRQEVERLGPEKLRELTTSGIDPLQWYFRQQAIMQMKRAQQMQAQPASQPPENAPGPAGIAQPLRSQIPGFPNQNTQGAAGNPSFDFFAGQQANAMQAQDAGDDVVPASNNQSVVGPFGDFNIGANYSNQGMQRPNAAGGIGLQQQQRILQQQGNQASQQLLAAQQARARANGQLPVSQSPAGANALTGQSGGLHGGALHQQSPLPMLNQPLPMEQANNTSQNASQQGTPLQGLQPHQLVPGRPMSGVSQPQPQRPQVAQPAQQGALQLPVNLPPEMRKKLLAMPPAQARNILLELQARTQQSRMSAPQQSQASQIGNQLPLTNQQNVPMNGQLNQQGMFPIQQLGNQINPQQIPPFPQQQLGPQISDAQRAQMLEALPLPREHLKTHFANINIPDHIQNWGQFKAWARQNASQVPPSLQTMFVNLQRQQFDVQLQRATQAAQHRQAMGVGQQGMPPGSMPPQAQQPPNHAALQKPGLPTLSNGRPIQDYIQPVTAQEIYAFKMNLGEKAANVSDAQIRGHLTNERFMQFQQQNPALAEQFMAQQRQRHLEQQRINGLQNPAQLGDQLQSATGALQPPFQAQAAQTQRQQPQPKANEPQNRNKAQAQPKSQIQDPSQRLGGQVPMQGKPSQPPADQKGFQAAEMQRKMAQASAAQQGGQPAMPAQLQNRLQQLYAEVKNTTPRRQPVQLNPQVRQQMTEMYLKFQSMHAGLSSFISMFFLKFRNEDMVRSLLEQLVIFQQQERSPDGTIQFSITAEDLQGIIGRFAEAKKYLQDASDSTQMQQNIQRQAQAQGRPGQMQNATSNATAVPGQQIATAPPMAKTASKRNDSKTPAAPTTGNPPFAIGATSPHGTPVYGATEFSPDRMKLPEKKKRKRNQAGSVDVTANNQAAGPASSPSTSTATDPAAAKAAAKSAVPVDLPFKCNVDDCEYKTKGFALKEELETHTSEAHIKIDDPLEYCLSAMRKALVVDDEPAQPVTAPAAKPGIETSLRRQLGHNKTASLSVNSLTPSGIKKEALTPASAPMSRVTTQQGAASSPLRNMTRTPQPDAVNASQNAAGKGPDAGEAKPDDATDPWAKSKISQETILAIFDGLHDQPGWGGWMNIPSPQINAMGEGDSSESPDSLDRKTNDSLEDEPVHIDLLTWDPFNLHGDLDGLGLEEEDEDEAEKPKKKKAAWDLDENGKPLAFEDLPLIHPVHGLNTPGNPGNEFGLDAETFERMFRITNFWPR